LEGRQVVGTYRGRTAIALACRLLGLGAGDEVLIPAYNCGTEFDALLMSGATPVAYRVTRNCELDFDDLGKRKSSRTKAVYVIHYFGWEQPLEKLRKWCDAHGLLLIEDCALALFSTGPSGQVGRVGDAAIFSLPKTLGFIHGGLLSLKSPVDSEASHFTQAGFSTLKSELRQSVRTWIVKLTETAGFYGKILARRRHARFAKVADSGEASFPEMPKDYYFSQETDGNRAIHPKTLRAAYSFDPAGIIERRRYNYARLVEKLRDLPEVTLLYHDLPNGVCPLSLPLAVSGRDACVKMLQDRGIAALPWWAGFHRGGTEWMHFPEACWLKRNVLTLPIHHGIDDRHLTYIAKASVQVFQSCACVQSPN
jgi:dTDP-4-amino-4,6-dideoxygalactose transaminase